jgi:hypothetical protein
MDNVYARNERSTHCKSFIRDSRGPKAIYIQNLEMSYISPILMSNRSPTAALAGKWRGISSDRHKTSFGINN